MPTGTVLVTLVVNFTKVHGGQGVWRIESHFKEQELYIIYYMFALEIIASLLLK